jgi:beta-phosphoglucomutase family hydrolase
VTVRACLFDLDGVLTQTAMVHAAAWKEVFDRFLRAHALREGVPLVPFDEARDYERYVDGKPRFDGVRSFLASRGIRLPDGTPGGGDSPEPEAETVTALGERKNELVLRMLRRDGVAVYDGSARYVRAVREAGLSRAVVSASANCGEALEAAGIADLFDVRVDAIVAERERLRGKPAPDTFLAAAAALGVEPSRCVVVGDIGADVGAAGTAGARAILVPTPVTRPEEVAAAPELAPDLATVADLLLGPAARDAIPAPDRRTAVAA